MRTGRCLCGAVSYELSGDLIATAVCHCDHCQRQSGGAFSVNLVVHESQLALTGTFTTYEERGENNDDVYVRRKFCPTCGSPVVSELSKTAGVIAVMQPIFYEFNLTNFAAIGNYRLANNIKSGLDNSLVAFIKNNQSALCSV